MMLVTLVSAKFVYSTSQTTIGPFDGLSFRTAAFDMQLGKLIFTFRTAPALDQPSQFLMVLVAASYRGTHYLKLYRRQYSARQEVFKVQYPTAVH